MDFQDTLARLGKTQKMNVAVVLMPESSWSTKSKNSYGSYERLSQKQPSRRELVEELATETQSVSLTQTAQATTSNPPKHIRGVAPLCYKSLEVCQNSTNDCSGHGQCYKKSNGTETKLPCFACQCQPQKETGTSGSKTYTRITHWGGGACQKEDISGPFWILAIFTVLLVGIVTWSIGMMYSIGEEKLPGVIGAGVSSRAG
jgi:hypothetical protein